MNRRTALAIGVAGAAGLAGVGAAWQRQAGAASADDSIWARQFDTPDGVPLNLARLRGQPLLLNFWATWCAPCVKELPLLERFSHDPAASRWRVVALAIDNRAPVAEFVQLHALKLTVALGGTGGVELSRSLGNASGSLPFTVVFDSAGRAAQHKLGSVEPTDLQNWLASVR